MLTSFFKVPLTLRLLCLMSSLWASVAAAHEVLPTIADLEAESGVLTLEIRLNLEAQLAGIDLDNVTNTDDAAGSQSYDALRARPGPEIAAKAGSLMPRWNALPLVSAGGTPVPLRLEKVETAEGENAEVPRTTTLRLRADLPGGAQSVVVAWPKGAGPLVLRQQGVEAPYTGYLERGAISPEIDLQGGGAPTAWQAFVDYIPVGFDHILPKGLDHILFVLGLFFLSMQLGPLLWQISAFTLAHTVTLALGGLGWVQVPGSIVEPLIAASIVYVAVENIFLPRLSPWRPVVVFCFGLLHGLGFASVLGDFGLPQTQIVPALLGFNIGVEFGQLTVVAMAAVLLWISLQAARVARLEGEEDVLHEWPILFRGASIVGSVLIGLVGAFWVIERTLL